MDRNHFETFTHCGLTFAAYTVADSDMGRPWDESDCHGEVREVRGESNFSRRPVKRPGERFLAFERGWGFAYDWQGTIKAARAAGWGLSDKARAELAATLKREPTRGEIVAEAVRLDFERLRAWVNGEWYWVGIIVELQDVEDEGTGEDESLWGIDSDSDACGYHADVARQLAGMIASRLNLDKGAGRRRKTFKRESAARSELIRVRA